VAGVEEFAVPFAVPFAPSVPFVEFDPFPVRLPVILEQSQAHFDAFEGVDASVSLTVQFTRVPVMFVEFPPVELVEFPVEFPSAEALAEAFLEAFALAEALRKAEQLHVPLAPVAFFVSFFSSSFLSASSNLMPSLYPAGVPLR